MNVTWEPAKAKSNFRKHGVDFADAAVALEDENALTILDSDQSEFRFKTLAMSPDTNILMIVHAEQDEDTVRIISPRKAEKLEERTYFQGGFHE
ncbi:MAG: BrnT family toxin [Gammaproteobacteria bacterium]